MRLEHEIRGTAVAFRWTAVVLSLACLAAPALAQVMKAGKGGLDDLEFTRPELRLGAQVEDLKSVRRELTAEGRPGEARFLGAYDALLSDTGGTWAVLYDRLTGGANLVEGSGIPWVPGGGNSLTCVDLGLPAGTKPSDVPVSLVADKARALFGAYPALFGGDVSGLVLNKTASGPVGEDLYFLDFAWTHGGVPVEHAHAFFRLNHGNLVQFGEENMGPAIGRLDPRPSISEGSAWDSLWGYLGGAPSGYKVTGPAGLVILPCTSAEALSGARVVPGTGLSYRLAYVLSFRVPGVMGTWEGRVDAHTGEVVSFLDTNAYGHIQGGVYKTDKNPTQTEVSMPLGYADYASGQYADAAGDYAGASGTSALSGKYVKISDTCGSISQASDGSGLIDFGTSSGTDCTTPGHGGAGNTHSSRTQYWNVTAIKLKAMTYLPSNTWLTQQLTDRVDLDQTCNAYWDGSALNFFKSGGGCGNTGELPGVSLHEFGHGLDQNDGNGSSPDSGTGETYGDVTAVLQTHQSCLGGGFQSGNCGGYGWPCTSCTGVRDIDYLKHNPQTPATPANFNLVKCPTGYPCQGPCGHECHCESAPSSQAIWDLATMDLVSWGLDPTSAWQLVDKLWYLSRSTAGSAFTCNANGEDGCGGSSYFTVFRVVDDCDGNLSNGTPHASAIYAAFNRHGIGCSSVVNTDNDCGCASLAAPVLAGSAGNSQTTLSWGAVTGASSYDVYRNETGCTAGFTKVGNTASTGFTDTNVADGVTYYYRVEAKGAAGCPPSLMSNCVSLVPGPGVPSGLTASVAGSNHVHLGWSAGSPAGDSYNVYRGYGACGVATPTLLASGVTATSYEDYAVSGGTTYAYQVTAVDGSSGYETGPSGCAQVTATGACTRPPDFAGVSSVTNAADATCTLVLGWSAGTAYCGGPVTYNVYRSTTSPFTPGAGNRVASGISATGYTDVDSLSNGTTYYYIVRAVDASNGSEDPNLVTLSGVPTGPYSIGTWTDDAGDTGTAKLTLNSPWSVAASGGHSGPKVYQTGPYGNGLCAAAVTPTLQLGTSSQLTFWTKYDIETNWDKGLVEISTNGGSTWQRVPVNYPDTVTNTGDACGYPANTTYFSHTYATPAYASYTASLAAWNNQAVMLRWSLSSDVSVTGQGLWVDDISITNVQVPGTCTPGSVCTPPGAPTLVSAAGSCSGATLSWTPGTGTTLAANVYRSSGGCGGSFTQINAAPVTATSYTDATALPGTSYAYKVRGTCDAGGTKESADSNCLSAVTLAVATPAAPTFSAVACTSLTVSWSAAAGATAYDLYRAAGGCGGSSTAVATNLAGTTFNDTTVSQGTTYGYYLVGKNASCTSAQGACATVTTATLPAAPAGVTATGTCSGVAVTWNPASGATSYRVMRAATCGGTATTFGGATSPFLDPTAPAGTPLFYWVVATNACGDGPSSACATATRPVQVTAPANVAASGNCDNVLVTWDLAPGATSYTLYRGAACGSATATFPNATSPFTDTTAALDVTYQYWVVASGPCNDSDPSACAAGGRVSTPPVPVAPSFAGAGCTSLTVTWPETSGATTYDLYRAAGSCGAAATAVALGISGTSYADSGLTPGTTYAYYLVAHGPCGTSGAGACSSTATLALPSITGQPAGAAIPTGSQTTLSVAADGPAPLSYQWYAGQSGDASSPIGGATGASFTTPALTATTTYWVRATGPCGHADSVSATVTVCTLSCTATASVQSGTLPLAVSFAGSASPSSPLCTDPISYDWDFGDGSAHSPDPSPSHTYSSSGSHTWTLTAHQGTLTCTKSGTVTVWEPLTASVAADQPDGVVPFAVGFTSTVGGGDGSYTYTWSFGDGGASAAADPSHTYTSAGTFQASLQVTDGSGHSVTSDAVTVHAYAPMSASLSATPTSGVVPFTVTFSPSATGGSGVYTYAYSYGDGSTGSSATHTYTAAGSYGATVTASDGTSHSAVSAPVTVTAYAPLSVTATANPTEGVVPLAVAVSSVATGGNGVYSFTYDFGDGTSGFTGSHTYTAPGTYAIVVTARDGAGQSASAPPVTVVAKAVPPAVSGVKKLTSPFRIKITGGNLQQSLAVYINGQPWTNLKLKSSSELIIKGGGSLKALFPASTFVPIRIVNPDTGELTVAYDRTSNTWHAIP